jgi:hypothetical protein
MSRHHTSDLHRFFGLPDTGSSRSTPIVAAMAEEVGSKSWEPEMMNWYAGGTGCRGSLRARTRTPS